MNSFFLDLVSGRIIDNIILFLFVISEGRDDTGGKKNVHSFAYHAFHAYRSQSWYNYVLLANGAGKLVGFRKSNDQF